MRTTLNLNEEIYRKASRATGIQEKTKLIHLGLETLIRETARKKLARLHGTIRNARAPARRKMS